MSYDDTYTAEVLMNLNNNNDVLSQYKTKSDAIRDLSSKGYTRSDIAKMLGIRYQHVRNVLVQKLKKS